MTADWTQPVGLVQASWWGDGHNRWFTSGIATALIERGSAVTAIVPGEAPHPDARILARTERIQPAAVLRGARWARKVRRLTTSAGCSQLIDVDLAITATRYAFARPSRPGIYVLHGQPVTEVDRSPRRRSRELLAWRGMRRVASSGGTVVVHTARLRKLLEHRGIQSLNLPVPVPDRRAFSSPSLDVPDTPFVLFVGNDRSEKGLPNLRVASARLRGIGVVTVGPAHIDDDGLTCLGFRSDAELAALQRSAAATVVPYARSYAARGAASAVAVEALINGCPVVLPDWMRNEVAAPSTSIGTFISDDPTSLARAISQAVEQSEERRSSLTPQECTALATRHSFGTYVEAILNGQPITTP